MITLVELATIARAMRRAQSAYFKNQTPGNLKVAKDSERRLDMAIAEALRLPGLFDEEGGQAS